MSGAGLTGSSQISTAKWIRVKPVQKPANLAAAQQRSGLGIGELSIIMLGRELKADVLLIDNLKARNPARGEGLAVLGCVGVLHDAFGLKLVSDLSGAYRQLLASGAYVDRVLLENILKILNLPPL